MTTDRTAATIETAFGPCRISWTERGLSRVHLLAEENKDAAASAGVPDFVVAAIALLNRYFSGERTDFSSVILDDASLGDFNRAVYTALRRIPYGETTTYGELARSAGLDAGASRAVGVAMGRNPWPVIVPCHRVLASGGKLGGFSAPGGGDTKRRLLRLEGAFAAAGTPDLPGLFD